MNKPNSNSGFLIKGFELFRIEFPKRFTLVSFLLEKIPGDYTIGSERFTITAKDGKISVGKKRDKKKYRIRASFDPNGIIEIVDGTKSVQQHLENERLVIFANADSFLILNKVIRIIIESAIWSSSLQKHFEDYRRWVYEHAN